MVPGAVVILFALSYVGFLFATASYGDRLARRRAGGAPRPLIYALSLGVYCTSWTFFGSVGLSARSGFDFLPIYIGPIIVFALGWRLVARIVAVSKRHNITSVADFISARFGKNQALGALVAIVAVIGAIPYISLQLKAVALALQTMLPLDLAARTADVSPAADYLALLVTIAMAAFASLFGTRHIDATEHQEGMILAIAVESIVKIASFLLVGAFVTFSLMGGLGPLIERVAARPEIATVFDGDLNWSRWITMTGLAMVAILLLPRQFHVAVVENSHIGDVRRAAWLFPLYLVAINLFVVPIAAAGLLTFGSTGTDPDSFVLALPVAVNSKPVAMVAFLGGLSAATAMVIVEAVALSIMVCNNLVLPILLRARSTTAEAADMGGLLILIRRVAISCILLLAFIHYEAIGNSAALAQIGLISFAAIAQLAPTFLAGLYWRRGTGTGASAAIMGGFAVWTYTLLIPSFADAGWVDPRFISEGPFGLAFLRPRNFLSLELDPLVHGVALSLAVNVCTLVAVSLLRRPLPIETIQANLFTRRETRVTPPAHRHGRSSVKLGELRATVAQYLGAERAERAFTELGRGSGQAFNANVEADVRSLRHAEHLLASAVGAASSRLIMWLLLERKAPNRRRALELLDDATHAIQYNRDLLQSAIDHVQQGIAVFDDRLGLTCWNRQFLDLLRLPPQLDRVGITLVDVFESFQGSGGTARSPAADVQDKVRRLAIDHETLVERLDDPPSVIEIRSSRMPEAGLVVTFADITERALAAEELERRVESRTAELVSVNRLLAHAKSDAEKANLDKTRFIAAASHDILQPLNAARLFASTLVNRSRRGANRELVAHLDSSLESVEDILSALLDISKLDAGAVRPEPQAIRMDAFIATIVAEHEPAAAEKRLRLRSVPSTAVVTSDRNLLKRILQNLISNAVKYTDRGGIVVGCRHRGTWLTLEVHDTGRGIPDAKLPLIFREFERLDAQASNVPGLGLGLSIVKRIADMLGHAVEVRSRPGRGSVFSVRLPVSAGGLPVPDATPVRRPAVRSLPPCRVLLVDNDPAILAGMQELLKDWGCETAAVQTAEACLAMARDGFAPNIVIADLHLDGGDGLSLIQELRNQSVQFLPAILITADRSSRVQKRAELMKILYMRKPLRPAVLRAALAHMLLVAEAAE